MSHSTLYTFCIQTSPPRAALILPGLDLKLVDIPEQIISFPVLCTLAKIIRDLIVQRGAAA